MSKRGSHNELNPVGAMQQLMRKDQPQGYVSARMRKYFNLRWSSFD